MSLTTMVVVFNFFISLQTHSWSKGYSWEFKEGDSKEEDEKKKKSSRDKAKEETGSIFQRQRVNILLNELTKKFPLKTIQAPSTTQPPSETRPQSEESNKVDVKVEVKTEPQTGKPPPEKKPRLV